MSIGAVRRKADWPLVRLADVADQSLGKMLDAKKNKGRAFPYLRNPNVRWFGVDTSDLRMMPFEDHELERFGLRAGDVLICEGGEAGRAAIWDGRLPDVKFQKAIHRVRTGPSLYNRFLIHRLKADFDSGRLADYYTGATIKHLTGQDLARYQFQLPPLPEQRRIAAVLDKANDLRAKRRAALEQLNGLTQSMFVEMFGEDVTDGRKLPTVPLSSVCKRITDGTHQPPRWATEGIPFLFVSNIVDGQIDFNTHKFISDETHAELTRRCPIEVGDVLYTTVGSYGNAALVATSRKFAFQRHIAHIKPDPEQVDSVFLAAMLQSTQVRWQADRVARGVAQKTVNLSDLSDFLIFLPSLSAQRTFTRRLQQVDGMTGLHVKSQVGLGLLFASLQHQAFSGAL